MTNDRTGRNEKELSVRAGEYLEILDDRRNWWRVRNMGGLVGHVPNTLLKPFEVSANQSSQSPHQMNYQNQPQFDTIEKVGYF